MNWLAVDSGLKKVLTIPPPLILLYTLHWLQQDLVYMALKLWDKFMEDISPAGWTVLLEAKYLWIIVSKKERLGLLYPCLAMGLPGHLVSCCGYRAGWTNGLMQNTLIWKFHSYVSFQWFGHKVSPVIQFWEINSELFLKVRIVRTKITIIFSGIYFWMNVLCEYMCQRRLFRICPLLVSVHFGKFNCIQMANLTAVGRHTNLACWQSSRAHA